MQTRIEVGILGATGMVGQSFIQFLQGHPWFDLKWLGASDRSAGKKYRDAMNWNLAGCTPDSVAGLTVEECKPGNAPRLVFSAMDASVATDIERAFAEAGHVVVSNSRNHRMERDVPLLVPEINPDHLQLVAHQQKARGWKGQIVTNPNCSTIVLAMGLGPLKQFGITKILATTMQAISGAGYPGVASMDIVGNVIPYIGDEEPKIEREMQKMLGRLAGKTIDPAPFVVSAHANRVAVETGHTVCLSMAFEKKPTVDQAIAAIREWRGAAEVSGLPSAPEVPLRYRDEADRPQPRRDVGDGRGMTVSVGRLREDPILDLRMVAMGHNTIRGAAGGSILNAEVLVKSGVIPRTARG